MSVLSRLPASGFGFLILALGAVAAAGLFGQQKPLAFKDRAESDLYERVRREQDGNTLVQLLDLWERRYPDSQWDELRVGYFVSAYSKAGDARKMLEAAKQAMAKYPHNLAGLFQVKPSVTISSDLAADALDRGEMVGKGFLAILPDVYDSTKKPASITTEQWERNRKNDEAMAYKTLGWVALQRQQWVDAEGAFSEVLRRIPGDAQVSSWTGMSMLRQKRIQTQWPGFYHYCRAAVWDGQGALPAELRTQYLAYVEKTYANFRGNRVGLDEILEAARQSPFPPPGILPRVEINGAPEPELKRTHPEFALWVSLVRVLTSADGQAFFDANLKNHTVPGGVEVAGTKVYRFKATVVAVRRDPKRKNATGEIVAGIRKADMPEVTLRFKDPQAIKVAPGMKIEFAGVPVEFTADPFNVTFEVAAEDVAGIGKMPKSAPGKW